MLSPVGREDISRDQGARRASRRAAALVNSSAELTRGSVPLLRPIRARPQRARPSSCPLHGRADPRRFGLGPPPLSRRSTRDLWVTPAPHPGHAKLRTAVGESRPRARRRSRLAGATAARPPAGIIQAFNPLDPDECGLRRPRPASCRSDLGPASFFAAFGNSNSWVNLDKRRRRMVPWTFHSPGGDGPQVPGGTIGYSPCSRMATLSRRAWFRSPGSGARSGPFIYPGPQPPRVRVRDRPAALLDRRIGRDSTRRGLVRHLALSRRHRSTVSQARRGARPGSRDHRRRLRRGGDVEVHDNQPKALVPH